MTQKLDAQAWYTLLSPVQDLSPETERAGLAITEYAREHVRPENAAAADDLLERMRRYVKRETGPALQLSATAEALKESDDQALRAMAQACTNSQESACATLVRGGAPLAEVVALAVEVAYEHPRNGAANDLATELVTTGAPVRSALTSARCLADALYKGEVSERYVDLLKQVGRRERVPLDVFSAHSHLSGQWPPPSAETEEIYYRLVLDGTPFWNALEMATTLAA